MVLFSRGFLARNPRFLQCLTSQFYAWNRWTRPENTLPGRSFGKNPNCTQRPRHETRSREGINITQLPITNGRIINHLVERLQLPRRTIQPLTVKHRDKGEVGSKMILNRPLTTPHNKTELAKPYLVQLLEYELNNRLQTQVPILRPGKDRQHLLGLLLSHGQEPRTQARS